MKLYLVGGGTLERLVVNQVKEPSVLVFHWTTNDKEKLSLYRKRILRRFRRLKVNEIEFAEFDDSLAQIKEKSKKANIIYLPGGTTEILIKTLKSKRVVTMLKNFKGIIYGVSAGAYALCKEYMKIRGNKIKGVKSLNFVNVYMKAHYSKEFENALIRLSNNRKIYGVPNNSALIWNGRKLDYFGKIYMFSKCKKVKVN